MERSQSVTSPPLSWHVQPEVQIQKRQQAELVPVKVVVWFNPAVDLPSWNPHYHFLSMTSPASIKECVCMCVLCKDYKCSA